MQCYVNSSQANNRELGAPKSTSWALDESTKRRLLLGLNRWEYEPSTASNHGNSKKQDWMILRWSLMR
jgi:hypothetical protein